MAQADDLFEAAFFAGAAPGQHKASTAITPVRELDAMVRGETVLRFTTAQARIPDLSVERVSDTEYRLSRTSGRRVLAFDLGGFMSADNPVPLKFADDMLDFEPEEGLVKQSKVPLWVLKAGVDGTVSIKRVWK